VVVVHAVVLAGKVAEKEVHVEGVRSWPRSEGGACRVAGMGRLVD